MKGLSEQLEELDDRADMTPMIDCVFLLLLFFIVTATFSDETLFKVELPQAESPLVRQPSEVIQVTVNEEGLYSLGDRAVPEDKLLSSLKAIHERNGIKSIIIKADKRCDYEKVVKIVDIANTLRIDEFSLAVKVEN